ncbi:hypothetical protein LY76DRAFT_413966 [Colletotrichum caudatum]|nr:hypothetical protein LY76DRAFT_413966 [Colletotrichum caudatum]
MKASRRHPPPQAAGRLARRFGGFVDRRPAARAVEVLPGPGSGFWRSVKQQTGSTGTPELRPSGDCAHCVHCQRFGLVLDFYCDDWRPSCAGSLFSSSVRCKGQASSLSSPRTRADNSKAIHTEPYRPAIIIHAVLGSTLLSSSPTFPPSPGSLTVLRLPPSRSAGRSCWRIPSPRSPVPFPVWLRPLPVPVARLLFFRLVSMLSEARVRFLWWLFFSPLGFQVQRLVWTCSASR